MPHYVPYPFRVAHRRDFAFLEPTSMVDLASQSGFVPPAGLHYLLAMQQRTATPELSSSRQHLERIKAPWSAANLNHLSHKRDLEVGQRLRQLLAAA